MIIPLFISGCVPILDFDDEFDYNPSKTRELEELNKTYDLYNRIEEIDVALYLNKKDFSSLVNNSFSQFSEHFTSLKAGEFSKVSFESMKFHFSHQQLVSKTGFSLKVDGLKRVIFGHIKAQHRFEAGLNKFIVKTDFDEIVLEGIDKTNSLDKESENAKLVEQAVKNFMHRLNGEIIHSPLSIPVDLNILSSIKEKEIFFSPEYKLHSAKAMNMSTKMQIYIPYINEEGVMFFGSNRLKARSEKLKKGTDIKKISLELREKINSSLHKNMDISIRRLQENTSYYISKSYLSAQMNASLKVTDLRTINKFFLRLDEKDQNLSKDIYLSDKNTLPSCSGLAKDCAKALPACNRNCSVNYGVHKCLRCDTISNPFEKVRCLSETEACKTKEELHLYACLKDDNRCEDENIKLKAQCALENTGLIGQCEEKKKKLQFKDDEIELARLQLKFDISNSYVIQRIYRMQFDEVFSRLAVNRNIHVSVDSSVNTAIENKSNEDIKCTLHNNSPLFSHAFSDYVNQTSILPVFTQTLSNGTLMIKAKSSKALMKVKLENRPFDELQNSDRLSLSCQYQNMPLVEMNKLAVLNEKDIPSSLGAMLGDVDLEFLPEEFSFSISTVKLANDMHLYPQMLDKAIGFEHQAQFY